MKRFRFRLQKVLDHKQAVKNEVRRDVMMKNHQLSEAERGLESLLGAEDANLIPSAGGVSSAHVYLAGLFAARLKREIGKQHEVIEVARESAAQAVQAYIEAAKEAQTLLTFKQKKLEQYRQYCAKEELKFLDELATQRGNTMWRELD